MKQASGLKENQNQAKTGAHFLLELEDSKSFPKTTGKKLAVSAKTAQIGMISFRHFFPCHFWKPIPAAGTAVFDWKKFSFDAVQAGGGWSGTIA